MLKTTLPHLRCPTCARELKLQAHRETGLEVVCGELRCGKCRVAYPILAGVAVVVPEPGEYLVEHVKGVSRLVPDSEIPAPFFEAYQEARSQIEAEHIEEDLEADRVIALYFMNHYLSARAQPGVDAEWWRPVGATMSPVIEGLIREHWDQGPLARITQWVQKLPAGRVIELGCGVAGLATALRGHAKSYLGVDGSFASIALGRHLALGAAYAKPTRIPTDLLQGPAARKVKVPVGQIGDGQIDLLVGDLGRLPVAQGAFDVALALNAIDMMPDPQLLIDWQFDLLRAGGYAIQSCPYIWHEQIARELRAKVPKEIRDSAQAVEWLYEKTGLKVEQSVAHLPWLFLKHSRQLEVYSVHLFSARK